MAEGLSSYTCNKILDAVLNNTSFAVTTPYLQLHTGAPGSAGTSNVATETTRKSLSFAAASSGSCVSDAAATWASISGSQDATHFTIWDASTVGNFLLSGTVTANAYTAGNTYNFASGALTLSFTTGAALSVAFANAILDAICNNTALVLTTPYGKLYTGDPGASGTTNAATETTRKSMSFAAASSASCASDADIVWSPISATGTEDATYLGLWTASTAGTYYGSIPITANPYGNGDTLTLASGNVTFSFTAAS